MDRRTKAIVLSIIPGLGHLYLGYPGKAVFWYILGLFGVYLATEAPAILFIVWFICMICVWSLGKHTLMAQDVESISRAIKAEKK